MSKLFSTRIYPPFMALLVLILTILPAHGEPCDYCTSAIPPGTQFDRLYDCRLNAVTGDPMDLVPENSGVLASLSCGSCSNRSPVSTESVRTIPVNPTLVTCVDSSVVVGVGAPLVLTVGAGGQQCIQTAAATMTIPLTCETNRCSRKTVTAFGAIFEWSYDVELTWGGRAYVKYPGHDAFLFNCPPHIESTQVKIKGIWVARESEEMDSTPACVSAQWACLGIECNSGT